MGRDLLHLTNVTHVFDGRTILHGIDWRVKGDEHWALLGPNGAGKTTLLRVICGYLWPNAGGSVRRKGKDVTDLGVLRRSMGWVTSTLAAEIPPSEKVLTTVISGKYGQVGFWEYAWERPGRRDFQRAGRYLSELGCLDLAERAFGTLSQGEQQKVLICRARMADPYLILLDEPCAGMDPGARETFLSSLVSMGREKSAPRLVYVTHHVEEIVPIFTRVLLLKAGRVLASGSTGDVLTPALLSDLYGTPFDVVRRDGRYWSFPAPSSRRQPS